MTPTRKKRLAIVAFVLVGVAAAGALALNAFQQNLMYFFSPTDVAEGKAPPDRKFRMGGLVKEGTVERDPGSLTVRFALTDTGSDVVVSYTGILPDLFREGQGIVANGKLTADGIFAADEVLAKHDETYMPPEVQEAIQTAQDKAGAMPVKE